MLRIFDNCVCLYCGKKHVFWYRRPDHVTCDRCGREIPKDLFACIKYLWKSYFDKEV